MERLALRALSSRADSFSGSICFISTEAERRRRGRPGEGEEEGAKKPRQTETEGDLIVKLDCIGKLARPSLSLRLRFDKSEG